MAKLTAHNKKKSSKRKLAHVRITHGANGYAVHHELERTQRPHHSMASLSGPEPDPKPSYFAGKDAHEQMMAHVGGLAQQMTGPDAEESGG